MFAEREGVRAQGVEVLRYRQGLMEDWFHTELVLLGKLNCTQFHPPSPALLDRYDVVVEMYIAGSLLNFYF